MIKVDREIYEVGKGYIKKSYRFDENKMMKLMIDNKIYATQISKFEYVTEDWDCDDDIYTLYGAYFDINEHKDFLTPEDIVYIIEEKMVKCIY